MFNQITLVGFIFFLISSFTLAAEPIKNNTVFTQSSIDINKDGQADTITIKVTSGTYYDGTNPRTDQWCGGGKRYEGKFTISVQLKGETPIEQNLNDLLGENRITFSDTPWQIHFDDYNHDGVLDFNLGQYGSCNGWNYKLFTFQNNGKVVPLLDDNKALFIADSHNSTSKIHLTEQGFYYTFYDNTKPSFVTPYYDWDKVQQRFVLKKTVMSEDNPET